MYRATTHVHAAIAGSRHSRDKTKGALETRRGSARRGLRDSHSRRSRSASESGSECSAINLRGHQPAASNSTLGASGMTGTDWSGPITTRRTNRDTRRRFCSRDRLQKHTSEYRSCHIQTDHSRNVTCHKPERCGIAPADSEHNLQTRSSSDAGEVSRGSKCSTPLALQPFGLTTHPATNCDDAEVVCRQDTRKRLENTRVPCIVSN